MDPCGEGWHPAVLCQEQPSNSKMVRRVMDTCDYMLESDGIWRSYFVGGPSIRHCRANSYCFAMAIMDYWAGAPLFWNSGRVSFSMSDAVVGWLRGEYDYMNDPNQHAPIVEV